MTIPDDDERCTSAISVRGAGVQCLGSLGHSGPHGSVCEATYGNFGVDLPLRGDTTVNMTWTAEVGSRRGDKE
jgi:hypothetical protein